jgi:hypothetical protein
VAPVLAVQVTVTSFDAPRIAPTPVGASTAAFAGAAWPIAMIVAPNRAMTALVGHRTVIN